MTRDRSYKRRIAPQSDWFHLGASGVLQPLSGEFLYRSPHDEAPHLSRWCIRRAKGKADATH